MTDSNPVILAAVQAWVLSWDGDSVPHLRNDAQASPQLDTSRPPNRAIPTSCARSHAPPCSAQLPNFHISRSFHQIGRLALKLASSPTWQ
eukprot:365986-Chlamydomonas_euryale.AAC.9